MARGVITPGTLEDVTRELEALKLRLVEMSASDLSQTETDRMHQEISAIRLQLKRLREDQRAMREAVDASQGLSRDPTVA